MMHKHRLILIIASLLAVAALSSACGTADANEDETTNCDGDVAAKIVNTEAELEDARKDAEDAEGTPAESEATDRVTELEDQLEALNGCPAGSTTTTTTEAPFSADDVIEQVNSRFTDFAPGELDVGTDNPDFTEAPEERGTAAFSQRTLRSRADVGSFLGEDTDVSRAAKARVEDAIRGEGYGDDEVARAMSGEGYFYVKVNVASQIMGTTYFRDGEVLESGEWRQVGANDVFWLFLTKDGTIIFGAAVRADCANPNLVQVRPVRPDTPPAIPVEYPPGEFPPGDVPRCPNGLPVPPNGLCPKDPSKDINNNPQVPAQVRKNQPSPDNQERIDRGPTVPRDTPSGCQGSCPTVPPPPPAPGVTVPSTNGGNTGVTAPPTSAPPPAPPTTLSPNVTVVSP